MERESRRMLPGLSHGGDQPSLARQTGAQKCAGCGGYGHVTSQSGVCNQCIEDALNAPDSDFAYKVRDMVGFLRRG